MSIRYWDLRIRILSNTVVYLEKIIIEWDSWFPKTYILIKTTLCFSLEQRRKRIARVVFQKM